MSLQNLISHGRGIWNALIMGFFSFNFLWDWLHSHHIRLQFIFLNLEWEWMLRLNYIVQSLQKEEKCIKNNGQKMYVHKIPLLISYILKIIIHTCYYYTLNETIQRSIIFVSDCMHLKIRGHALCTITQCEVANFCYKLVLCGATYFNYMQKID